MISCDNTIESWVRESGTSCGEEPAKRFVRVGAG